MSSPSKDTPETSVSLGMDLPLFAKGRGGPSLWSAKAMNRLVRVLRAVVRCEIRRGSTDQVFLSDGNFVIQLAADTGGGDGSGGVGMYQLQSVQGDYVTLLTWDGTTLGSTAVLAAKEYKLRNSLTGETIFGTAHAYTYGAGPDSNNSQRNDSDGTKNENQLVTPAWTVNEVVYAVKCQTGVLVSGTDVGLLLIRTGAWARSDPLVATQVGI